MFDVEGDSSFPANKQTKKHGNEKCNQFMKNKQNKKVPGERRPSLEPSCGLCEVVHEPQVEAWLLVLKNILAVPGPADKKARR